MKLSETLKQMEAALPRHAAVHVGDAAALGLPADRAHVEHRGCPNGTTVSLVWTDLSPGTPHENR